MFVSSLLKNHIVGLEQIADGISSVHFGPLHLGWIDEADFCIMDMKEQPVDVARTVNHQLRTFRKASSECSTNGEGVLPHEDAHPRDRSPVRFRNISHTTLSTSRVPSLVSHEKLRSTPASSAMGACSVLIDLTSRAYASHTM